MIDGFDITHPLIQNPKRLIPQIPISFGKGKDFNALVDTGSTITVVSAKLLEDNYPISEWNEGPIVMLDGSFAHPVGSINLEFRLGKRKFIHTVAVMDSSVDVLLGMDFLALSGLMLDMANLQWGFQDNWPHEVYPLSCSEAEHCSTLNLMLLNDFEKDQIKDLIAKFPDVIDAPLGRVKAVKHRIKLIEEQPKRQRPYPMSKVKQEEADRQVDYMLKHKIIRKSKSPYASPILLREKPDGTWRFCVDYRHINKLTPHDSFPIPRVQDLLRRLANAKFMSTLDAEKGYWQIEMDPRSRQYTAFCTERGLFEYNCMPFGLKNAPATFQRMMGELLRGLEGFTLVYQDDVLVFSKTFEEHLGHIVSVLERFRQAGLTIKGAKCQFGQSQIKFLGHIVSENGLGMRPEKVATIKAFPLPKTRKQLRSFLGAIGWYRHFIEKFADIAAPLNALTSAKVPFRVTPEVEHAFHQLKEAVCED